MTFSLGDVLGRKNAADFVSTKLAKVCEGTCDDRRIYFP